MSHAVVPPAPSFDQLLERLRDRKDLLPCGESALIDVRAVAKLLSCSTRHVYRLADGGRMPPPVRLGALVRWKVHGPGGLLEWLVGGCRPVRSPGAREID